MIKTMKHPKSAHITFTLGLFAYMCGATHSLDADKLDWKEHTICPVNKEFKISCPADQVVVFLTEHVVVGFGNSTACSPSGTTACENQPPCEEPEFRTYGGLDRVFRECAWKLSTCTFKNSFDSFGHHSDCSCKEASYLRVKYKCVESGDIYRMCDQKLVNSSKGFILTPSFPEAYNRHAYWHCSLNFTEHPGRAARLQGVYMDIWTEGDQCPDYLNVSGDGRTSDAICQRDTFINIKTLMYRQLSMSFNTGSHDGINYGFVIYFEYREVGTIPSTSEKTPSTVVPGPTNEVQRRHFPILLIIGTVLSTAAISVL